MSEPEILTAGHRPDSAELSAGMLLRQAREATGLHIAALAVAMKVPVKRLEALEADRLGELPDAVFVRALAGSMCRALKIDPAPVLSRLPQSAMPKFERDDRGINMPFHASGMRYGNTALSFVARPAAMWVIGLLVAALLVLYFPEVHTTASKTAAAPAVVTAEVAAVGKMPEPTASAPVVAAVEAAVAPVSSPVPVLPAPAKAGSEVVAAAVAPVASSADLLVFKAKSSAWVRVSDAKGAVQFEKTLAAGETASATGTLPLAIVVGNVSATELMVRGQPFNLEEVAKNNVARFEVK